jgi:hypothetical protein
MALGSRSTRASCSSLVAEVRPASSARGRGCRWNGQPRLSNRDVGASTGRAWTGDVPRVANNQTGRWTCDAVTHVFMEVNSVSQIITSIDIILSLHAACKNKICNACCANTQQAQPRQQVQGQSMYVCGRDNRISLARRRLPNRSASCHWLCRITRPIYGAWSTGSES